MDKTMDQYRISHFWKTFRREDITAIYHSTNMELVFVDNTTADMIAKYFQNSRGKAELLDKSIIGIEELINHLIKIGLLVSNHIDEMSLLREIMNLQKKRFIRTIYLILTDDCNLNCGYCFENKYEIPDFQAKKMDLSVCRASLNLLARLNKIYPVDPDKKIVIQLYGGEPLLNFPAIVETTLYTEELINKRGLPINTEIATITNGTRLTREMVKFFDDHRISVGISMDGPQEMHDRYRVFKNKKGTYNKVLTAYKMLSESGVNVGVSCTLTPEAIKNFSTILDFLQYEIGIKKGLGFNLLSYNPRVPVDQAYYTQAADWLVKAYDIFRGKGIWEERMMRKAESFVEKKIMFADCAAIGHQLVISPDGKIGICPDFIRPQTYFDNSVFDESFDPYQNKDFLEWSMRSPWNMPECIDCEAIAICGGGCPANAEVHYGSMWKVDKRICPHSKISLEWLIFDQYRQPQQNS